eukprot:maker-scaffold_93-snap-gene-0.32-mRNA-1 protein AED:0.25 eAED:0.25 QI:194/1/0.5/1/1/1/2/0/1099
MGDLQALLQMDPEIKQTYKKLQELEELMHQGRVPEKVYNELVKQQSERLAKLQNKSSPPVNNRQQTTKTPKSTIRSFRPKKVLSRIPTRMGESRSRGTSGMSSFASFTSHVSSRNMKNSREVRGGKILVADYLLRLGVTRFGKKKWKRLYVELYSTAIAFYEKKSDKSKPNSRPKFSYPLDPNTVVSEPQGGALRSEDGLDGDIEGIDGDNMSISSIGSSHIAGEHEGRQHVFLLDFGETRIYLSAEDEVKKEYWVSMLVATLSDIRAATDPTSNSNNMGGNVEQMFNFRNEAMQKYETNRARPENSSGIEGKKYDHKAERFVIQSVNLNWKIEQKKQAMEQEKLRAQLQNAQEKLKDKENENEQLKQQLEDQEDKFKKMLEEARKRNLEKEGEKKDVENKIKKLRRMSVRPGARDDEDRDFEREIEALKTKLKALESALNMDIGNLDWDGTLEDAEEKMRALIPKMMNGTEKEMQEAQTEFDQWDNIIRNHADFHKREEEKWRSWEEGNKEPNLAALEAMRQMVPPTYKNEKDIIEQTGVKPKVASRFKKNQIFKFFYMDKDKIARVHEADLLNKYACQGLDIREMRAVYACMPDEFLNDAKGTKKKYRDTIRDRLKQLTDKEAKGTLTADEKENGDYGNRMKKKPKPRPAGGAARKRKPKNAKIAGLAAILGSQLEGPKSGPPKKKKPGAAAGGKSKSSGGLDPADPKYKKYFTMHKMHLPDGAIEAKMREDGLDASLWQKLKEAKAKGSSPAPKPQIKIPEKEKKLDPNDAQYAVYFKMQASGLPEGAIMNRMQKDGKNPALWVDLVLMKEEQDAKAAPSQPVKKEANNVFDRDPKPRSISNASKLSQPGISKVTTPFQEMKEAALKKSQTETTVEPQGLNENKLKPKVVQKKKKKKKSRRSKNKSLISSNSVLSDIDSLDIKITEKRTRRARGSQYTTMKGKKLLNSDANDLLNKVNLDLGKVKARGSHGINLEYATAQVKEEYESELEGEVKPEAMNKASRRPSRRKKKKGKKKKLTQEQVIEAILSMGEHDPIEGGLKTTSFGKLSEHFKDRPELLRALLIRGKRSGHLKYKGDTLFVGIHDDVCVTVMKEEA